MADFGAAQRIQIQAPGDVILVDGPDPKVFLHYYDGTARSWTRWWREKAARKWLAW
jgi:hypothetical protein